MRVRGTFKLRPEKGFETNCYKGVLSIPWMLHTGRHDLRGQGVPRLDPWGNTPHGPFPLPPPPPLYSARLRHFRHLLRANEDGGRRRETRWRPRLFPGFRLVVAAALKQPAAGPPAPEQPPTGAPDRGHRDRPELHVLRRDQPAPRGEGRTHTHNTNTQTQHQHTGRLQQPGRGRAMHGRGSDAGSPSGDPLF